MVIEFVKDKGESVIVVKEGENLQVFMVIDGEKKEEESDGFVREDCKVEVVLEIVFKDEGGEIVNKVVDCEKEQVDNMVKLAIEVSKNINIVEKGEGLKIIKVIKKRIVGGENIYILKDKSEEENLVFFVKCGELVVEKDSDVGEGKRVESSDLMVKDYGKLIVEEILGISVKEKIYDLEEKIISEVESEIEKGITLE